MKTVFDDKNQMKLHEPETPKEAVETLKEFLLCHVETGDLNDPNFLKSHFKICIEQIEKMEETR